MTRSAKAVPVFMYHHVSPSPGLVTLSPAIFRSQLAALAAAGWRTAGLDDLAAFLAGRPLPVRTCVLTFDDGYLDNYAYAHPILQEFGMKATLFVVTGWLGDGPVRQAPRPLHNHAECKTLVASGRADEAMIRWSEAEAMQSAGTFEFHSHSHTHQRWDRRVADPEARRAALAEDLVLSRQALTQRLGRNSSHLCWPQGYHDDLYRSCAVEVGFDHLYTTEKTVVSCRADRLRIGRIVTKERDGAWLTRRADIYSRPWLGRLYNFLQGRR